MLDVSMTAGTVVSLHLPQVAQSDIESSNPVVINANPQYPFMKANWRPFWHGRNQTLDLTANIDVPSGLQSFSIGSSVMHIENEFIYKDDNSIDYSVMTTSGRRIAGGYFDSVLPTGFASSSLEFSDLRGGDITEVKISFIAENSLVPGDKIRVFIPNIVNEYLVSDKIALNITGTIGQNSQKFIKEWLDHFIAWVSTNKGV
jgi:hypothetical protein